MSTVSTSLYASNQKVDAAKEGCIDVVRLRPLGSKDIRAAYSNAFSRVFRLPLGQVYVHRISSFGIEGYKHNDVLISSALHLFPLVNWHSCIPYHHDEAKNTENPESCVSCKGFDGTAWSAQPIGTCNLCPLGDSLAKGSSALALQCPGDWHQCHLPTLTLQLCSKQR